MVHTLAKHKWIKNAAILCVSAGVLSACAARPDVADRQMARLAEIDSVAMEDPYENVNRAVFAFNDALDTVVLRPAAQSYRAVVPDPAKDIIRNFLRNLSTPVILLNDLLQGNTERAKVTTNRFLLNTTVGMGGLFDVAEGFDMNYHSEDFGQTIAVWNNSDAAGPYIVLPIFGPSNARDAVGRVVDVLTNPLTWVGGDNMQAFNYGRVVVEAVDGRYRLLDSSDFLKASTDDYYAAVRSVFEQNRDHEIRNGGPNLSLPAPGDEE